MASKLDVCDRIIIRKPRSMKRAQEMGALLIPTMAETLALRMNKPTFPKADLERVGRWIGSCMFQRNESWTLNRILAVGQGEVK